VRSELKTRVKRAITAAEHGEETAADAAKAASSGSTRRHEGHHPQERRRPPQVRLQKRINKASAETSSLPASEPTD